MKVVSNHCKPNSVAPAVQVVVAVVAAAAVVARPAAALKAASTVVDAQAGPVGVVVAAAEAAAAGFAGVEVAAAEVVAVAVGESVGWAASPVQAEHGSVPV